jgi:ribonuclease VapC
VVLDSSAVVALLLNEPEATAFREALRIAEKVTIGAPTLLECELVVQALLGAEGVMRLDELIMALGADVVPFGDRELAMARLAFRSYGKGRHPAGLNYGDCFSYAVAVARDEALLFKGEDFSRTDVRSATEPRRVS